MQAVRARDFTPAEKAVILTGLDKILKGITWSAVGTALPDGIKAMQAAMELFHDSQKTAVDKPLNEIKKAAKDSLGKKGFFGAPVTRHPMTHAFYMLVDLSDEQPDLFKAFLSDTKNVDLFIKLANQYIQGRGREADSTLIPKLLCQAVDANSAEVFALLSNAVPDAEREKVLLDMLFYAAFKNAANVITFLQGQEVNFNMQKDDTNQTALHIAARAGAADAVTALLAGKANSALRDANLQTPLHVAVIAQKAGIVPKLASRANVNLQDKQGNTAAHYAANLGLAGVLITLVSTGARLDIANTDRKTVSQLNAEKCTAHADAQTAIRASVRAVPEAGSSSWCCGRS